MSPRPTQRPRRASSRYIASFALIASVTGASAGTWTWDGVTGGWNTGSNWNLDTVPISAVTTSLVFGGASTFIATDDIPGDFSLNRLILQSSAATAPLLSASGAQVLAFSDDGASTASIIQNGSGDFQLGIGITAVNQLHFSGAGAGVTRINGIIGGSGGLSFDAGRWQLTNIANTFTGGVSINTGATLELLATTGPVSLDHSGSTSILGGGTANSITINGGTLKVTPAGVTNTTGTGGNIIFSSGASPNNFLPLTFGPNGGVFDLTHSNPAAPTSHSGTIGYWAGVSPGNTVSGGDLSLALSNTATAVIRFNGGQMGLSNLVNPQSGDWNTGGNTLRIQSYAGGGPVRIELTNGAMARAGTGSNHATVIASPTTYRGVMGGDSSSGVAGNINPATSLITGRVYVDRSAYTYTGGLVFQDAIQVASVSGASRLTGGITLAGIASGHPAMVTFAGRTTGNALSSDVFLPRAGGNGQNPLYLGTAGEMGITVEEGALANFDARIRIDLQNHSGVYLDGNAVLLAGGTMRIGQSVSSFTLGMTPSVSAANVGDIILFGDIEGRGSSSSESIIDLRLPVPSPSGTIANGIPQTLTPTTLTVAGVRPFGGLDVKPEHSVIVNGTGFGGLRIEARARPNALFSVTGNVGGAPKPDPVDNITKIDGYLTPTRLSQITGSGGYLTVAPIGQAWSFPSGGEWVDGVTVGARVSNHNPSGTDISFAQLLGFSHNIAVDAGATVDFGGAPFNFGPAIPVAGLGVLHGKGTVLAAGGLTVAGGGRVAPGLADIGTLAIENVTLNGELEIETSASAADLLSVAGNLVLGATSQLSVPAGSVLAPRNYKIAAVGTRSGTFGASVGLSGTHSISYTRPGEIWLTYSAAVERIWTGNTNGSWNTSTANWVGPTAFSNTDKVTFDDTAAPGNRNVAVSGGDVEPTSITVNTAGNYSLTSNVGAAIIGTGELVKTGPGTLTLSGPASFQGGVLVEQGVLATSAPNSIPDAGKVFVSNGAQLNLGGVEAINELLVSGSVTSGSALTVGTLTLDSAGSFQAPLVLQNKLLKSGAPLTLPQGVDLAGGARTVQVASSTAPELTFGGTVTNGALIKSGPGTLVLGVLNDYQSGTTVQEGTLRAAVSGALPANRDVSISSGATLDLNGFNTPLGAVVSNGTVTTTSGTLTVSSLSGLGGMISLGVGNLLVNQAGSSRYDGNISTTGNLTKSGVGALTLGGSNTFGGGIQISAGSVRMAASNAGGTGNITVSPGGTLVSTATIGAQVTLAGGTFGSRFPIQQAATNLDVVTATGTTSTALLADPADLSTRSDLIFDGPLRGNGNILIQAGANPLSADNGSGFRLHNAAPSDFSGSITAGPSTKFELQSVTAGSFSVMGTGKIIMTAGSATAGRNGSYSQLNLRNNSAGDLVFGNDVEITGSGLVNFGPTSTGEVAPEDSRIVLGNLKIGADQIAAVNKNGTNSQIVHFSSVTLTGGEATFSPSSVGFGFGGTSDLMLGSINENAPNSGILMVGQSSLILLGNNTYTGATKLYGGTTRLAGANALPAVTSLEVSNNAIVHLNSKAGVSFSQTVSALSGVGGRIANSAIDGVRTLTVNQTIDTIYEGTIEGNINLLKQGPGTLRIAGSVGGEAIVAGGTLGVGNGTAPGSIAGNVTVQNGARLRGFGELGGVTVDTGGKVMIGDTVGSLTTASFTLQAGSTLGFDLNGATPGTTYDQLNVGGVITLNGSVTLELQLGYQPGSSDSFILLLNNEVDAINGGGRFVYQGNMLEQGEIFSVSTGGFQQFFEMQYNGNDGNDAVLAAVPEPSVTLLLLGGLAVTSRRRRR